MSLIWELITLPLNFSGVHPVFYVSMLKRYHVDGVLLDKDLFYEEEPIVILDRDIQKLRIKYIKSLKIQRNHRPVKEATWDTEKDTQDKYPQLFIKSCTTVFLF